MGRLGSVVVVNVFTLCFARMVDFAPRFLFHIISVPKKIRKETRPLTSSGMILFLRMFIIELCFMVYVSSQPQEPTRGVKFNASASSVTSYTSNTRPVSLFCPRLVPDYCHGTNRKRKVCHWIIVTLCFKELCLYDVFFCFVLF